MTLSNRSSWLPCLAAVWLLNPEAAQAGSRGVRDGGGLFEKSDVVEDVNRQIQDLHRRYGVDLLVETFAATPADRAAELRQLKAGKFFPLWAEERAMAAGVEGVYVLVCKAPRHVEVHVGEDFQKVFDKRACDRLRRTLEQKLDRKWQDGLQESVDQVRERLARQENDAKSGGWAWVVWTILAIVGVWLSVMLVRRFRSGRPIPPPHVVTAGALSGESIYRALAEKPASSPGVSAEAPTLPYPGPQESEGTVHG